MADAKPSKARPDPKAEVPAFHVWQSTVDGMTKIAEESRVSVDHLVNGVLCEFIAKWHNSAK